MAAAAQLGCSYGHLRMCLKGIRRSWSLMERYRALRADPANAAKRKTNSTKD